MKSFPGEGMDRNGIPKLERFDSGKTEEVNMKYSSLVGVLFLICVMASKSFGDNGQRLICYGPDNLSVELSADQSWMKVVIEGEGGWAKVFTKRQGKNGSMIYVSTQGVLVLQKGHSTFTWHGDDQRMSLRCGKK